jgi:hypothetical protein
MVEFGGNAMHVAQGGLDLDLWGYSIVSPSFICNTILSNLSLTGKLLFVVSLCAMPRS